ncbi:MAG: response regulator [Anaerolineae bacterium]|nr:response regulator [Anaerolineae bacterium]MDW8101036.1 response regulator [Anaerolineae bacterium]
MDRKQFVTALRTALMQLDDLQSLRRSPLLPLLARKHEPAGPLALQQALLDAIESLKKVKSPLAPRAYEVLYYRYVEQLTQKEVAFQLGISERQLRREQANAIELLADALWQRLTFVQQAPHRPTSLPEGSLANRDLALSEELAWLREGFGLETSHVSIELAKALREASVLAQHYHVILSQHPPPDLPPVAVPPSVLRQALLTALTAAIPQVSGGTLSLALAQSETNVVVTIQRVDVPTGERPALEQVLSALHTASQLLAPFGGRLNASPGAPLRIDVIVPTVGSIPVLVIDDNPDARQLFQRYAENSRFRVITTADCDQAIPLVQSTGARAIVLDIMMPAVDGWDVLARLRHHPTTQHIPILVCTILPQKELAGLLGATAFLQKPVSQQAFLEALDRLVSGVSLSLPPQAQDER